jgi:hypothetical protein
VPVNVTPPRKTVLPNNYARYAFSGDLTTDERDLFKRIMDGAARLSFTLNIEGRLAHIERIYVSMAPESSAKIEDGSSQWFAQTILWHVGVVRKLVADGDTASAALKAMDLGELLMKAWIVEAIEQDALLGRQDRAGRRRGARETNRQRRLLGVNQKTVERLARLEKMVQNGAAILPSCRGLTRTESEAQSLRRAFQRRRVRQR